MACTNFRPDKNKVKARTGKKYTPMQTMFVYLHNSKM